MIARIELAEGEGGVCVRVSGHLEKASARELLEVCRDRRGVLLINLEELLALDRAAIQTLQDLRSAGACIVGASHYITMLLNGWPDDPAVETDLHKEEE